MQMSAVLRQPGEFLEGIWKITDEDYFSVKALNVSTLKSFAKAPALAHVSHEETASMRLGTLTHCAILEPEELDRRYQATNLERRGTRAWGIEEDDAISQGKFLIKQGELEIALMMQEAVWNHSIAREILEGCKTEMASFWIDEETGLPCKAKADILAPSLVYLADLKTTVDASFPEFTKQFTKMGYWLQETFYRWGFAENGFGSLREPTPFLFIAVEKDQPYLVSIHEMNRDDQPKVIHEMRRLINDYSQCLESGHWPGYPDYQIIHLPQWAF
jgi:exodeoxyribonuclease VIII